MYIAGMSPVLLLQDLGVFDPWEMGRYPVLHTLTEHTLPIHKMHHQVDLQYDIHSVIILKDCITNLYYYFADT